ncbi:MAG TPA: ATP-binding cassette domain-containing protein [Solirubrobacterales bacterium]|nr:ATP-binding cassette domain-containing protein [Solirubrobacterales bacterium]
MPDRVLALDGVTYRYPDAGADSLRELRLEVGAGELVALAGRSGSGKTTLLRAACGLVPHFHGGEIAGRIEIAGLDTREHGPAELAGRVGYVAQDPETQVVSTTVRAEIALPLELRGDSAAARARAVEEVALALAIPHLLDRTVDGLSGGELQRVALAAALVARPPLVLLDEPTSQLDPVAGDELISLLRRLNEEWGTAVILCEHRLERCLGAADRVVALADGAIAFDGPPGAFLDWAIAHDRALATPAARLFDLAGLRPLPASVKQARVALAGAAPAGGSSRTRSPASTPPAQADPRCSPGALAPPADTAHRQLALSVRDLWVELDPGGGPRDVIRALDLEVRRGERIALMGRNGAGKSTLLRCAAGLVEPAAGSIDAPAGVALLSQNPGDYLVRERVGDELPGEEGRRALDAVGLGWAAGSDPRDLSGGERQRLALAIVMAGRGRVGALPGVVGLDEPTRGMDRARKDELVDRIDDLARNGSAVVVATHDVEFAATFAERVVLLGEGELIADGPCGEVLAGGWYFATEVARIVGGESAITPEQGAAILAGRHEAGATA